MTDLEERQKVMTFIELLQAHVDGRVTREALVSHCDQIRAPYSQRTFAKNTMAEVIFDSVGSIDNMDEGQPIVRKSDLITYLAWLREGDRGELELEPILNTTIPLATLAERLKCPTTRFWVNGIGWQEVVWFASPLTGRVFHGMSPVIALDGNPPGVAVSIKKEDGKRQDALQDFLDTALVPVEDINWTGSEVDLSTLPTWKLKRQDDNGTEVTVATYRSQIQAEAAVVKFEARGHKQIYWVDLDGRKAPTE